MHFTAYCILTVHTIAVICYCVFMNEGDRRNRLTEAVFVKGVKHTTKSEAALQSIPIDYSALPNMLQCNSSLLKVILQTLANVLNFIYFLPVRFFS